MNTTDSNATHSKTPATHSKMPFLLMMVTALTALHTLRLIGGTARTLATVSGSLHPLQYLPGVGDMIAGLFAPAVVWLLLTSPTVRTRNAALLWNSYGLADLVVAILVNVAVPPEDLSFRTPGLALSFLATHIVHLLILRRKDIRAYFHRLD